MLPSSNPKSPKRRHQQIRLRELLSPKAVAISLFMVLNVGWFLYTMLASHNRNSSPQTGRTGLLPEAPKQGGLYGTQNQPSYAGRGAGDTHDSRTAVQGQGIAGRRPWENSEGGLFQPHGASSQQQQNLGSGGGAAASGTVLKSGAEIEDLVVKGSVTSGDLKLTGNILSSSSGKLLVSAGVVGVGTSMLDAEHDKLVVNGPIRLTDAGTRPSCDPARRGMIWHEFGEMGQADTVDVCAKGQSDDYAWRPVLGGGGAGALGSSAQARQQWAPANSQQQLGAGLGGGAGSSLSREFRVAQGSELRAGDVVTFVEGHAKRGMAAQLGNPVLFSQPGQAEGGSSGASKRRTSLLALSHDLCLVIHSAGAAAKVSAQVAKVHGTNAELAAKQPFGSHRAEQVDLAALSPREFIMVYNEPTERNAGYVVLGNVVGNSAKVFSQPVAMEPSGCNSLSVAALSPSLVVIAFNADTANGPGTPTVLAASVEGRKVVFGNRTKLAGRMDGFVVVPMSISTFVLVHRNIRQKGAGGRVGHVAMVQQAEAPAGEDAGEDAQQQQQQQMELVPKAFVAEDVPLFSSTRVLTYLAATRLSSWQIAIAYADGNEGNVLLAGVVGDSLTPQPAAPFSSAKPLSLSLSALSESAFILSFYTHDPWRAVVVKGFVQQAHQQERAGPGLSLFETTVTTDYTTHTHSLALSPHSFLMTYYDGANSDAGTAVVGAFGRGMGVAGAAAAEGEMVPVRFGGISGDHESLEVGSCYYSNEEGRVTTFASELRVGLAVSVSEILMGGC